MTYSTLTSDHLIRITVFEGQLITLDEDGVFDLWHESELGDVVFDRRNYMHHRSIRPSEVYKVLKKNTKRIF